MWGTMIELQLGPAFEYASYFIFIVTIFSLLCQCTQSHNFTLAKTMPSMHCARSKQQNWYAEISVHVSAQSHPEYRDPVLC